MSWGKWRLINRSCTPEPDRFSAYNDAPLGEKIFNISVAEMEAPLEFNRLLDQTIEEMATISSSEAR